MATPAGLIAAAVRRSATQARDRVAGLPITPGRIATAAMHRHFARRDRIAATDPTWAEIEARRQTDRNATVLFSDDRGLGIAEWATQSRIEEELCPDPWWMPAARKVTEWPASRAWYSAQHTAQRARRGWSDFDSGEAGRHLARVAAGMLAAAADTAMGWPHAGEFPAHDDWTAALRANAELLARWESDPAEAELLDRWSAALTDPDTEPGVADQLRAELEALQAANLEGARAALRWIADHLDTLWD